MIKKVINPIFFLSLLAVVCFGIALIPDSYASNKHFKKNQSSYFNPNLLKSRYVSWGISPSSKFSINLEEAWKNFSPKKQITVAIIDTGIDPNHKFLKNNIIRRKKRGTISFGIDFSKKGKHKNLLKAFDKNGHGTHVAGIIKSILPSVKILPIKYFNPNVSNIERVRATINAFKYAIYKKVDIINFSGGGQGASALERKVIKMADKKGILVVTAAGNNNSNLDKEYNSYYPACYKLKNIISVTAYNRKSQLLSSSNYGKKSVDICAPGERIRSAFTKNRAAYMSGTSMATGFVTGVAALLKSQYPRLTPAQIKMIITLSARQSSSLRKMSRSKGRLDAANAIRLAPRLFPKETRRVSKKLKKKRTLRKKSRKKRRRAKKTK